MYVQPTDFDLIGGTVGSLELHELRRFDGACIVSVGGEIDESTVEAFEYGLEAGRAGSRALVVDLTGCTVSSDGMAALLDLHRSTRDPVPVTLVVRDPDLLRMLDVVGLTTKLGTYPTVNAALSSNSERARHEYQANFGRTRRPGRLKLTTDGSAANALEQQPPPDKSRGFVLTMATVNRWAWLAKLRKRRNAAAIGRAEATANQTDAERASASGDRAEVAADGQAARIAGLTPSEADRLGE